MKDIKPPKISHETKLTIVRFFAEHSAPKIITKKKNKEQDGDQEAV
ncbi:hypothetical protein SAMN05421676_102327 [Salinibacillus kushneri]|uniref:Uncharacterized protein n=1 Tax=Salinibacillus kushneri TaxID=237682 RepID=A0A1I0B2K1_9BACI|nr:hypothetical protein [Salinibacillus kushneri]SET00720.1 hypothetical protein SAMN05421676_102327 [Salinibacillus kushneri]